MCYKGRHAYDSIITLDRGFDALQMNLRYGMSAVLTLFTFLIGTNVRAIHSHETKPDMVDVGAVAVLASGFYHIYPKESFRDFAIFALPSVAMFYVARRLGHFEL